jgi:uncharacterized protein DUF5681
MTKDDDDGPTGPNSPKGNLPPNRDRNGRFQRPTPSPNPRGRPKKPADLATAVSHYLRQRISVSSGSGKKKKRAYEVIGMQLVMKAAQADFRFMRELNQFLAKNPQLAAEGVFYTYQEMEETSRKLWEKIERMAARTEHEEKEEQSQKPDEKKGGETPDDDKG